MSLSEKLEAARVALGKRKQRELQQLGPPATSAAAKAELLSSSKPALGIGNDNKLLAGNLAHEFLTHGTLMGRRVVEPTTSRPVEPEPKRRYAEVSWLLMATGAHVRGVVNPTQLARWLHIKD